MDAPRVVTKAKAVVTPKKRITTKKPITTPNERVKAWRAANRERYNETMRKWRAADKAKKLAEKAKK